MVLLVERPGALVHPETENRQEEWLNPVRVNRRHDPEYDWLPLSFPWYVPIGSTVAFVFGVLLARPNAPNVIECSTEVRDAHAPALE